MTQINNLSEARLAFEDWCKHNAFKLSTQNFVAMYGIRPDVFQKKYWKRGLQKFWIKWQKKT